MALRIVERAHAGGRTHVRPIALLVALALAAAAGAGTNRSIGAAPRGDERQVAFAAIRAEGLPCPRVVDAWRDAARAIIARCSNRQRYLVFRVRGYPDTIVLTCAQAREQTGHACRKDRAT